MKLQNTCSLCDRPIRIDTKVVFNDSSEIRFLKCGHVLYFKQERLFDAPPATSALDQSGHNAWDYQTEGVEFISKCNGTGLIADEMGLGKTVQGLLVLRNAKEKMFPSLLIVKSSTLWQWFNQYKKWTDLNLMGIFMIRDTKGFIPPGFQSYVISMDTFSRMVRAERNPYGKIINISINPQLAAIPFKSVIIDECQSFKDPSSNRTTALVAFLQHKEIEHKIFLSGTPIKNRADEYFTTLNIIDPDNFSSIELFRRNWLVRDGQKWTFVSPYRLDAFRELIANYVIRRETKDVLKDLPEFRRTFETISIEDEKIKELYNAELERLREISDSKENFSYMDVEKSLMTLRRLIGMAKIDFTSEYVDTFLDTVENEKIAIGVHHHAVRDILYSKLLAKGFGVLKLSGEDSGDKKEEIKNQFINDPSKRVLVISTLAGGVGIDGLQKVCSNVIGLERQWSSVDEEQFEKRFHRPGQEKPVICEYFIAKGTIDDFFHQLVEMKRQMFGETVGNDWNMMSDSGMLRNLVHQTVASRL